MGVISAVAGEVMFTPEHEALMILIAAMSAPHVEIARLSRLTQVDPLTGSLNRRGLDEHFPEVEVVQGDVVDPLSVVMVDIDLFKQINDEHGHAVGDVVLKHVANVLSRVLRGGDAVVRVGGEEFLLVLPGVDLARATVVAERARSAVEAHPTPIDDTRIESRVSMGVAQRGHAETRDAVIARADEALYRAKLAGRNRVVAATPERRDEDRE
jgi:diguanylate cyclase (GGDEF)-like protein